MVSNLNKLTSPPQGVAVGIVGGKKIKVGKWHEMPRKKPHFFKMYLGNGVILSDDTPNILAEAG